MSRGRSSRTGRPPSKNATVGIALDEARSLGDRAVEHSPTHPGSAAHALHLLGDVATHPDRFDAERRAAHYLKALALAEPRGLRPLLAKKYTPSYEYVAQMLKELPYGRWREYDPENTIRFYALRLHEAGLIRSTPQKLIAKASDWSILNALKKEMKA